MNRNYEEMEQCWGTIEVSIWRNDVYMLTVNRKENEVNDFIINV